MYPDPTSTPAACPVVLVIEDDPGDAQLIRWQLLERSPTAFDVHIVESLAAAERKIHQGIHPDVVLLDLNLPDSFGISTVASCRKLLPDAPIVVLTGLDQHETIQTAIAAGAEDFLSKGTDGSNVRKAIRYAILRHDREADARLAATVFTHASEGIMITSPDGHIIECNAALSDMTGYPRDELLNQPPYLLNAPQHQAAFDDNLWSYLQQQGQWQGEVWNQRKNGELFIAQLMISAVYDGRGVISHYVCFFTDITLQKQQQQQLERLAHFDALTGLPNRALLADRLSQEMRHTHRQNSKIALIYIDLDGFKAVNDTYGHQAGDVLLTTVARRMRQALRETDTVARLGGDEFVAVVTDLSEHADTIILLDRLLGAAAQPVAFGDAQLQVSASIGVALYPVHGAVDADFLLRQADQAMYRAKQSGKNRYRFFDPEEDKRARELHQRLERLHQAFTLGEFFLLYQPQVNMRTGELMAVEALLRWQLDSDTVVLPRDFLPILDNDKLCLQLGEWVVHSALQQMLQWQTQGLSISVSVNLSARQFQSSAFLPFLGEVLARYPELPRFSLCLEIIETSALDDMAATSEAIRTCNALGVAVALDDFGTGYSSLDYIRRLSASQLKIDHRFVGNMLNDPDDLAMLEGVLGLAHAFRCRVVAEGVESEEQGNFLLRLGCELAQGFAIAHPMPAEQVAAWLATWQPPVRWRSLSRASRDLLPLLFAAVEHRAWIRTIESHLSSAPSAIPLPALDETQCRFGQWLLQEDLTRYGSPALFAEIDRLHREIHQLARQLLGQQQQDMPTDGAQLQQLRGLSEQLFALLVYDGSAILPLPPR